MSETITSKKLQAELEELLYESFPYITINIEHHERWDREAVTFTWNGFADLLPEERFERLSRVITEEFKKEKMKGYIWLELAPDESIEDFLAFPRSEDIEKREQDVYKSLVEADFFSKLKKKLGSDPLKTCKNDFRYSVKILQDSGFSDQQITDVKLLFIYNHGYRDCAALLAIFPELHKKYSQATDGDS